MKVHTFIEQITENVHTPGGRISNDWRPCGDDIILNTFLERNKDKELTIESHIETIRGHNNGGYNDLIKVTIVTEK